MKIVFKGAALPFVAARNRMKRRKGATRNAGRSLQNAEEKPEFRRDGWKVLLKDLNFDKFFQPFHFRKK